MGQVKIRLTGLPEDVDAVAALLTQVVDVLEESGDYQNRNSEFVRRYLTATEKSAGSYPPLPILQIADGTDADGNLLLHVSLVAASEMSFTMRVPSGTDMDAAVQAICRVAPSLMRLDTALAESAETNKRDILWVNHFATRWWPFLKDVKSDLLVNLRDK